MTPNGYLLLLLGSVLGLYAAKYAILRSVDNRWLALSCFAVLLFGQTLGLYATDPEYPSPIADPKAHWIGLPVAILGLPASSFLVDWFHSPVRLSTRYIARTLCEVLLLFPAWVFAWVLLELFVLGWIWI